MSTYAFRIICKLAGNYDDFEITEGKIPLVLPAFASLIHVILPKAKDRTAGRTLILQSGDFSSDVGLRFVRTLAHTPQGCWWRMRSGWMARAQAHRSASDGRRSSCLTYAVGETRSPA
jgi:hypothetical protein